MSLLELNSLGGWWFGVFFIFFFLVPLFLLIILFSVSFQIVVGKGMNNVFMEIGPIPRRVRGVARICHGGMEYIF